MQLVLTVISAGCLKAIPQAVEPKSPFAMLVPTHARALETPVGNVAQNARPATYPQAF